MGAVSESAKEPQAEPLEPAEPEDAAPGRGDPRELLQPRIDQEREDWIGELGDRRAFRVRGFTWFRRTAQSNPTALGPLIPAMEAELRQRPGWAALDFPWWEAFSPRQLFDAANQKPMLFPKAAKTILLCEIAAVRAGMPADEVYKHMHIEPAVHRITDFTRGTLEMALAERDDILNVLVRRCRQQSSAVFYELADRKTVSLRLATRVHTVLHRELPGLRLGVVMIGWDRQYRNVSEAETVDGPSLIAGETERP